MDIELFSSAQKWPYFAYICVLTEILRRHNAQPSDIVPNMTIYEHEL